MKYERKREREREKGRKIKERRKKEKEEQEKEEIRKSEKRRKGEEDEEEVEKRKRKACTAAQADEIGLETCTATSRRRDAEETSLVPSRQGTSLGGVRSPRQATLAGRQVAGISFRKYI